MSPNVALYWVLRLAAWTIPFLPARVTHALADAAGRLAFHLFPGPRTNVLHNLAVVLNTSPSDEALRPLAEEAFRTDAKNWADTLRISRTSATELEGSIQVDRFDLIADALHGGKGLVLVTLHLGNFDLVGQLLVERGYRLTVPVERMQPERLFDFLVALRTSKGINVVALDHAPREMIKALRNGEIVGVAGDRLVGGRGGISVPFFGRNTLLPQGPVSLARRCGAPLLIGVGIRRPDDRFEGHVVGPIPLAKTSDGDADDEVNLSRLASEMEKLIRQFPGQWLTFSRMWPQEDSEKSAGTMGQKTEAMA